MLITCEHFKFHIEFRLFTSMASEMKTIKIKINLYNNRLTLWFQFIYKVNNICICFSFHFYATMYNIFISISYINLLQY